MGLFSNPVSGYHCAVLIIGILMRITIEGSQPLRGRFKVGGNSNAAIALIAASMLTDAPVKLSNVPNTTSTQSMLQIAGSVGLEVTVGAPGEFSLKTPQVLSRRLERTQHTGAILLLAPMLARRQFARLELDVPLSRYNTHLTALRDLGCTVKASEGVVELELSRWQRQSIVLTQASVTATSLIAMLATTCGQETTIHNAACEPHVTDLLHFLVGMGAQIEGIGSNLLHIRGVEALRGGSAVVAPDHIEAASIAALTALTDGRVIVEGVRVPDLTLILKIYERLGLRSDIDQDTLNIVAARPQAISERDEDVDLEVATAPWPGFPSDLAAVATVVAAHAQGTVLIHEKMYSNRLLFVDKLNAMGAQIVLCDPHRAIVIGPTRLQGEYIDNPDVRTGLAMLGAALCAEGKTVIDNAEVFDRTFESVIAKLVALGAAIKQG
jgi:UDP-N-acetylglucosamine 1-carboxyvinyltransferase